MNKISDLKVGDKIVTKGLHKAKIDNILFDIDLGWSIVCGFKCGATHKLNESEINWQKTNELNNKQMELIIEAPTGMEVYQENNTIKFRNIENKLPMSVEEIPNRNWYIDAIGGIKEIFNCEHINQLSTKERAQAFLALIQLVELRDAWNGDWKADYNNGNQIKYLVTIKKGIAEIAAFPLYFKSRALRDQFAEQFKDLIDTAKELL